MWISTFHALCARLLRREAPHIGLSRDFVIYDSADQQSVVKQLVKEYGLDDGTYQPRVVLSPHQPREEPDGGPRDVRRRAGIRATRRSAGSTPATCKALKDASALDFDDLLLKTVELFDQAPAVRERYARKFQFVMVDEYQDTNRPQYLLIKQLVERAPQPVRRRRSRPVDLQVARRRPAQHPRLRERLSRRRHRASSSATTARRR